MSELSPFTGFDNFTATFTVSAAGLELDEWGNSRPATAPVQVIAVMQQLTLPQQYLRPKNLDEPSIYIGGFLVIPRPLPIFITPQTPCSAIYNGLIGSFVMEYTPRDAYMQAVGIDIAEQLKGWFVPKSFVAVA